MFSGVGLSTAFEAARNLSAENTTIVAACLGEPNVWEGVTVIMIDRGGTGQSSIIVITSHPP